MVRYSKGKILAVRFITVFLIYSPDGTNEMGSRGGKF